MTENELLGPIWQFLATIPGVARVIDVDLVIFGRGMSREVFSFVVGVGLGGESP